MTYLSCFMDLTYFIHLCFLPGHQPNFPLLQPWPSELVSAIWNSKTLRDSTESQKRIFWQEDLRKIPWSSEENTLIFVPCSPGRVKKHNTIFAENCSPLTFHRIHICVHRSWDFHNIGWRRRPLKLKCALEKGVHPATTGTSEGGW